MAKQVDANRIVVLTGGRSHERAGSLASAAAVGKALSNMGHKPTLIDLSNQDFVEALMHVDCAFVATHGWYGEDGKLQGLLEMLGLPYTGSGVLANAVGLWKPAFKRLLGGASIPMPRWETVDTAAIPQVEAERLVDRLGLPQLLKPASGGGSLGVRFTQSLSELVAAVAEIRSQSEWTDYLAEEFIDGVDLSVGVLDRSGRPEPLPVLQTTHGRRVYDYEVKHSPSLRRHDCPAPIDLESYDLIQHLAVTIHELCHCHGISRVDFLLAEDSPRALEINTVPGYTRQGNLATMAAAAGMSYQELVQTVLDTAFSRPDYEP